MTESSRGASGGRPQGPAPGESWERRAAEFATEVQRWLIKVSTRSMRDEIGGQVRRAIRGREPGPDEVWATVTTESPEAAADAPECAWCPVCRAARRITRARERSGASPGLSDAAEVMAGAVRDALAGLDSILSYRPPGAAQPAEPTEAAEAAEAAESAETAGTAAGRPEEPAE